MASPGSPGLNGSVTVATDANQTLTLQMLKNLSASDILLTICRACTSTLKSDSNTRILANRIAGIRARPRRPRLGSRACPGHHVHAHRDRRNATIVSFNYENIGVNIDITPRTHHDDDVTLLLNVAVTNISGTGAGGLPTFGRKSDADSAARRATFWRDSSATTSDNDRRYSRLSDLPGVGRLFGHTTRTRSRPTSC